MFTYLVVPVVGAPSSSTLLDDQACTIEVSIPEIEVNGIRSYFNRAVVSSQAFSNEFPNLDTAAQQQAARAWLGNGMQLAVPNFLNRAANKAVDGAIYHLTDTSWIIPALQSHPGAVSLTYNHTRTDTTSDAAVETLVSAGRPPTSFILARTRTSCITSSSGAFTNRPTRWICATSASDAPLCRQRHQRGRDLRTNSSQTRKLHLHIANAAGAQQRHHGVTGELRILSQRHERKVISAAGGPHD